MAVFHCAAPRGVPTPRIYWKKDDQIVRAGFGRVQQLTNGSLIVNEVRKIDEGRFVCIAENMLGIRESSFATLTVYGEWLNFKPFNFRSSAKLHWILNFLISMEVCSGKLKLLNLNSVLILFSFCSQPSQWNRTSFRVRRMWRQRSAIAFAFSAWSTAIRDRWSSGVERTGSYQAIEWRSIRPTTVWSSTMSSNRTMTFTRVRHRIWSVTIARPHR